MGLFTAMLSRSEGSCTDNRLTLSMRIQVPKSASFRCPLGSNNMLSGFTSLKQKEFDQFGEWNRIDWHRIAQRKLPDFQFAQQCFSVGHLSLLSTFKSNKISVSIANTQWQYFNITIKDQQQQVLLQLHSPQTRTGLFPFVTSTLTLFRYQYTHLLLLVDQKHFAKRVHSPLSLLHFPSRKERFVSRSKNVEYRQKWTRQRITLLLAKQSFCCAAVSEILVPTQQ